MPETKMSRSEVVGRAYFLASDILVARANDGTIAQMLIEDDELHENDATRIENEVRKIGERLAQHVSNLRG